MVPRESFGFAAASLASLYRETAYPFELIYVDAGSPGGLRRHLEKESREKGFRLIRRGRYQPPNQSRNLGLAEARTKYVVFSDNDVIFSRGWLESLVLSAEETGAAVVGPLICEDEPHHENIHNGGGMVRVEEIEEGGEVRRHVVQKTFLSGERVSEQPAGELGRLPCGFVEFHCVMVRRDLFGRIGPLDEGLLSTREHIDLCLLAAQEGEGVVCDRQSLVTYMGGVGLRWSDVCFYMLRWSDAWDLASLEVFRGKWRLAEDWYFQRRYRRLGERRVHALIRPVVGRLPFGRGFEPVLGVLERWASRWLSQRYARRHPVARGSLGRHREEKRLGAGARFLSVKLRSDGTTRRVYVDGEGSPMGGGVG
nr:LasB [uncultured Verrucomicrobiota bacterium]UWK15763.1 LasB [uncultured Verrucomicrobiota bacterium]